MTYETYRIVFLAGLIGCVVMLCVTVLLFFLLGIPRVVGDLSGHTAKRAINDIRQRSEKGERMMRNVFSPERVRVTDRITGSGNIALAGGAQTEFICGEESTPADYAGETSLLCEETTLLGQDASLLDADATWRETPKFEIEYEITYVFSDEIIIGAMP